MLPPLRRLLHVNQGLLRSNTYSFASVEHSVESGAARSHFRRQHKCNYNLNGRGIRAATIAELLRHLGVLFDMYCRDDLIT